MSDSFLLFPAVNSVMAALPALAGVIALVMGGRAPSTLARRLVRAAGAVLLVGAILNGGLYLLPLAAPDYPLFIDTVWTVADTLLFIVMLALLVGALGATGRRNASGYANAAPPTAAAPGAPGASGLGWGGPPGPPAGPPGPGGPPAPGGPGAPGGGYPPPGEPPRF